MLIRLIAKLIVIVLGIVWASLLALAFVIYRLMKFVNTFNKPKRLPTKRLKP